MEALILYNPKRFKKKHWISISKFKKKYKVPEGIMLRLLENKILHFKVKNILQDYRYWSIVKMLRDKTISDIQKKKWMGDYITYRECSELLQIGILEIIELCDTGYLTKKDCGFRVESIRNIITKVMLQPFFVKVDFFLIEYLAFYRKITMTDKEILQYCFDKSF